mgnify:CR=1 FL=1
MTLPLGRCIFTTQELYDAGIGRHHISTLVRRGALHRVIPGLYTTSRPYGKFLLQALQHQRPDIVFTGRTAVQLHNGHRVTTPVTVLVARDKTFRSGPLVTVMRFWQSVTEPQPTDLVGWTCGTSSRHRSEPPTCPASAPLHAVITFPDCWDGERTDSSDHRAHMANSAGGRCPESHPVHVPQLTFVVAYPVWGDGHELSLASGPTITLHADFMNAWDHEGLGREIELCLHRDVVCNVTSNRGEEPLFGA